MITKSKIKIYNNKKNLIKIKKLSGGQENDNQENDNGGEENNSKIDIDELNNSINGYFDQLKNHLQNKINDFDLSKDAGPEDVCTTISNANFNGEFNKNLYGILNKYFKQEDNGELEIDGEKLMIDGNLSQLIYSKIINGKIEDKDWPSQNHKKLLDSSLQTSMSQSITGLFPSKKKNNVKGDGEQGDGDGDGDGEDEENQEED